MIKLYEDYARVLVEYSLDVQKGDKILIKSSYHARELVKFVYRDILKAGGHPEISISLPGIEKSFYDFASDEQLEYIPPSAKLYIEKYDGLLNIEAPYNLKALQSVDPQKKQKVSIAKTALNKTFMERAAAGNLKWTLCVFPTESAAQEAGMSKDEYSEFVFGACFLFEDDPIASWRSLRDTQQRVVDLLNTKSEIHYKSSDIDVKFSTKGRLWLNSAGTNNMPSGEVFSSPIEDSVNGKVRFSYPGIFMGQEIEDITLEIKDGLVVSWDAKQGRDLLDKVFEIEGARRFGEVAVGMNYGIQKFTKNMLFDEKIGGTIHMAIGASYPETGGKNESSIHWDLLGDMSCDGEIFADGEKIYDKGKFTI